MRKFPVIAGSILILIGLAALTTQGRTFGKPLQPLEKKWTFAANDLHHLNILSNHRIDVAFVKSGDGTNGVSINGQGPDAMVQNVKNTELAGGTLALNLQEPDRNWFEFLNFNISSAKQMLVVSLSDGAALEALKIDSNSGSVHLTDAEVKTADLSVESGSINIDSLTADRLNIQASSGSVKGDRIKAETTVEAESGSVRLDHVTGRTHISANSGSVKLYKDDTTDTDIEADSGSVYVHLPSSFAGSFDVQADSGIVRAPEAKQQTKDLLKVRASSGSVRVEQG